MQKKEGLIGYIYGDVGSTEFNIAVNGQNVRKFDYIYAPHKEGRILAQIMDIKQHSNLKFEDASQLIDQEEKPLIKTNVSAFVDVIGFKDKRNLLQSPRTPFDAGTEIFNAEEDLIRNVLGLSAAKENGAYVGLLKGHDLQVYLNIDTMVQKHICILAKTGGGKSYACGVLVEELLKNKIPLVIIDTHGEYRSLKEPNKNRKEQKNMEKFGVNKNSYSSQIIEYSPLGKRGEMKHITLNGVNLEANEILDLLPSSLSGPQKGVLYQAIKEIKEYKSYYTIRDIIDTIHRSKSNARWNVIASLESLDAIGVFSENATNIIDLVKKGKCSLINMKGVPPDVQSVVVARLTKQLFENRKAGKVPPFLFIVEEAHNYCPERGFGSSISSSILRTIASEGRKFGMGLCVVSQRPAKVDKNIISQCNTNIILKVTNPNDLKAIIQSVEGLTNQTYREIQRLPIGVGIVAGGTLQMPVMVEIRTRETNHGGKSVKISKSDTESFDFKPEKSQTTNPSGNKNPTNYQPEPSHQTRQTTKSQHPESYSNPAPIKQKTTQKAETVTRVAYRLGWVNTDNSNEAIKILSEEAEKMNENVYKYLESLSKLGTNVCTEQDPKCMNCPMKDGCKYLASLSRQTKKGILNWKK